MSKHRLTFISAIIACLGSAGCGNSLVYSPSTLLPAQPLTKDSGQIIAGLTTLAETRPDAVRRTTAPGREMLLRYAFSDRVTLQTKGWTDFSYGSGDWRSGILVGGIVTLGDSADAYRLAVAPAAAAVLNGSSFEGGGSSVMALCWLPHNAFFHPYLGAGPAVGFRNLSSDASHRPEWGWGVISTFGIAIKPYGVLDLTIEANGIFAVDEYDHSTSSIVAPAFCLGMDF